MVSEDKNTEVLVRREGGRGAELVRSVPTIKEREFIVTEHLAGGRRQEAGEMMGRI